MSAALLNRLARLEDRMTQAETEQTMLIVSFVAPGETELDRNILSATCNGQTFVRTLGETSQAFHDRVDAETKPAGPIRVVFLETEALRADGTRH